MGNGGGIDFVRFGIGRGRNGRNPRCYRNPKGNRKVVDLGWLCELLLLARVAGLAVVWFALSNLPYQLLPRGAR